MASLRTGRLCSVGAASSPASASFAFAACAATKAAAKSARELSGFEAPSASVNRTENALVSGNLRCSVVIRSLCEIIEGTITTRASAPQVALTATGGPHFCCCARWRSASAWRACNALRSASCAAVRGASFAFLASAFLPGARPSPPSPAGPPAGFASAGASMALAASTALRASSLLASAAAAAAASALAFLPWPSISYALAR